MSNRRWFVMLRTHDGLPLPLMDWDDQPLLYPSETAADNAAAAHQMGIAYGWEAYEWTPLASPSSEQTDTAKKEK